MHIPLNKILLEDNVFRKDFHIRHNNYIGFNSYRKCMPLTCGSLIRSPYELRDTCWRMPPDQIALLLQSRHTIFKHYILENRDEVQKKLAEDEIYLPVFWRGSKNVLSEKILSIPLDDRYTKEDIERVENLICRYRS